MDEKNTFFSRREGPSSKRASAINYKTVFGAMRFMLAMGDGQYIVPILHEDKRGWVTGSFSRIA